MKKTSASTNLYCNGEGSKNINCDSLKTVITGLRNVTIGVRSGVVSDF